MYNLIRIAFLSEILLHCLCSFVDSGCPPGFANQDLQQGTEVFQMACIAGKSTLTPVLKLTNGSRNIYHDIIGDTSCEIGAQNVFYLRRITFWTIGASKVRIQVKQDNFNNGPIVIDDLLLVEDTTVRTRHLFTIAEGYLPRPIGQPNVISFRLTFTQDPAAPQMQAKRLFARTCIPE